MRDILYAEAVRGILWPGVVSHPNIAFAVGMLSQFIQNTRQAHWEGLKRVISYFGTMKDHWLTFGSHGKEQVVDRFCDADWAGQRHRHRHLISGYLFHMGNGAMAWRLKKQYIVTLLSTEAEYIVHTHVAKEALYL